MEAIEELPSHAPAPAKSIIDVTAEEHGVSETQKPLPSKSTTCQLSKFL